MKKQKSLEELYEKDLKPELKLLEQNRKFVLFTHVLVYLVGIIGLLFYVYLLSNRQIEFTGANWIFYLIPAVLVHFYAKKSASNYAGHFKTRVVAKMVSAYNKNWIYEPKSYIDKKIFDKSNLINNAYDTYKGDDLIKGKVGNTCFELCDLYLKYTDSMSENPSTTVVFRGLFAVIDFNKNTNNRTFLLPDHGNSLISKLSQKPKRYAQADLVNLENPEFENLFDVYSTSQIEARYIFTPKLMEAFIKIKSILGKTVRMSFIDSKVYLAIWFEKGLFEPNITKSGVNFEDVKALYEQLNVIEIIINEMDLNTRIWSKN